MLLNLFEQDHKKDGGRVRLAERGVAVGGGVGQ